MDFSSLKKRRGSNLENLTKKLDDMSNKGKVDERLWNPQMDKSTNTGYAVIRFLPSPDSDTDDFVRVFSHSFQGPGGWYIEKSLSTLGQEDPVGKSNKALWDTGSEANKNIARKRKRKTEMYANVYVVKDPANPDNEGKVFLYKFGQQIFSKIEAAIKPKYDDVEPIDPFDMWTGANFKVRIVGKKIPSWKGDGSEVVVPNYEDSLFDLPSELFAGDDAKKEELWKQTYSLKEFVDPATFKSYEDLEARFKKVTGTSAPVKSASDVVGGDDTGGSAEDYEGEEENSTPAKSPNEAPARSAPVTEAREGEEDESAMDFFDKLERGEI